MYKHIEKFGWTFDLDTRARFKRVSFFRHGGTGAKVVLVWARSTSSGRNAYRLTMSTRKHHHVLTSSALKEARR